MKRRDLLRNSAALGLLAAAARPAAGHQEATDARPLKPPAKGSIPVAFLVSEGAVVIDFLGPWEVFQDVQGAGSEDHGFRLYTVAESKKPIRASGGLQIVPDHDLTSAPPPKVIVIPAQSTRSPAVLDWIRKSSQTADVTMSVCTGAFLLAKTGLLDGKPAATHHSAFTTFAMDFPKVHLKRGARFVEEGNLASAGGLSSGIDLALRVVERYYGREVARRTADYMEYQGQGWLDPSSNSIYAKAPVAAAGKALCPVCSMEVDQAGSPKSVHAGKTYYFCMPDHQQLFEKAPDKFLQE